MYQPKRGTVREGQNRALARIRAKASNDRRRWLINGKLKAASTSSSGRLRHSQPWNDRAALCKSFDENNSIQSKSAPAKYQAEKSKPKIANQPEEQIHQELGEEDSGLDVFCRKEIRVKDETTDCNVSYNEKKPNTTTPKHQILDEKEGTIRLFVDRADGDCIQIVKRSNRPTNETPEKRSRSTSPFDIDKVEQALIVHALSMGIPNNTFPLHAMHNGDSQEGNVNDLLSMNPRQNDLHVKSLANTTKNVYAEKEEAKLNSGLCPSEQADGFGIENDTNNVCNDGEREPGWHLRTLNELDNCLIKLERDEELIREGSSAIKNTWINANPNDIDSASENGTHISTIRAVLKSYDHHNGGRISDIKGTIHDEFYSHDFLASEPTTGG
eukprot:3051282-Ditylum_brightwellii.AAC.1